MKSIKLINYIKISTIFTILFSLLSLLLIRFQLHGITDEGFILQTLYNLYSEQSIQIYLKDGMEYILRGPFIGLFTPLVYFFTSDPIGLVYALYYIFFLGTFLSTYYLFFGYDYSLKNILILFTFMFAEVTVIFHYSLNFNGLETNFFAIPFLILSYKFIFIDKRYLIGVLLFLPTLFIKLNFWLIFGFLLLAIYIYSNKRVYILYSLMAFCCFILLNKYYFEFLGLSGLQENRYYYIFNAESIGSLLDSILSLPNIEKRVVLIGSFFIPFLVLIRTRKVPIKEFIAYALLILPIIGYSFLSYHTATSYFLFEHYSLPIIPVLLVMIKKFIDYRKATIFLYFMVNIGLALLVLYNKQPWQYKYYQDELQLVNDVIPKANINEGELIFTDDRSGIYFSHKRVNYLEYYNSKKESMLDRVLIINVRYTYSSKNLKHSRSKVKTTYDYLNGLSLSGYEKIYEKYPFLVFKSKRGETPLLDEEVLDRWDQKTIESNKWF